MTKKQKLELTWIGKDVRPKLEPRILLEDPSKSYHAKHRVKSGRPQITPIFADSKTNTEASAGVKNLRNSVKSADEVGDIFDNRLIFGDNLLALKALEQEFTGKVKCVFIDPPYNTGSAFTHYDDGVEHSIWLSLMRDRLEIIRRLLSDDGSLWITIDDNEAHYLKVMCDEIFGRNCSVANVAWRSSDAANNDAKTFSVDHNHILVYSKNPGWLTYPLPRTEDANAHYKNPDHDPNGSWFMGNLSSPKPRPNLRYTVKSPLGHEINPPANGWRWQQSTMMEMIETGEVVFSSDGKRVIKKTYLKDQGGLSPSTMWDDIDDTGHNRQAKYELKKLFPQIETSDLFATPKPERLIRKVLLIATKPNDLVLDSFAGSGTTGAVAHKMSRRWIMIELGEHCHTHIIPRLHKVIDGEDQGGISKSENWQGGGGFRYYHLAPSLLLQDAYGQWVINKDYNAEMLAAAICKLEGFSYAPSADHYWQHGYSTENDFIYVTTQSLNAEQLQALSDEVGHDRTLLVCCAAFRGDASRFSNLTVKKIPKMVLQKCEWGHDDYSLNVENLPQAPKEALSAVDPSTVRQAHSSVRTVNVNQAGLFVDNEGGAA